MSSVGEGSCSGSSAGSVRSVWGQAGVVLKRRLCFGRGLEDRKRRLGRRGPRASRLLGVPNGLRGQWLTFRRRRARFRLWRVVLGGQNTRVLLPQERAKRLGLGRRC